MRKIVSLMVIFIMVTGCQSSETVNPSSLPTVQSAEPIASSNEKLTIYKIKAGTPKSDEVVSIFKTVTDKAFIDEFVGAFKNAEPLPGAVKMTYPPYKVQLGAEDYYLWINEKKNSSMVNLKNTMTMYTLSESATYKLRQILSLD